MKIHRNAPKIVENDRDVQFIHSAPKMLSTALKMPKNQGLDSIPQNKKNKNKKFREKAAERRVSGYGGGGYANGLEIDPFTGMRVSINMSVFVTY